MDLLQAPRPPPDAVRRVSTDMSNASWSPLVFGRALHERRVLGLAAAYAVVGFGLLEGLELVLPRLQMTGRAVDLVLAGLLFALPLVLFATWRYGAADARLQVASPLPVASLLLVGGLAGWMGLTVLTAPDVVAGQAETEAAPPLVIMMDSPHPERVYDPETVAANGN